MCENWEQLRELKQYCYCQFTGVTEATLSIINIKLHIGIFFSDSKSRGFKNTDPVLKTGETLIER